MKLVHLAALTALTVTLAAPSALAQQAPSPPAAPDAAAAPAATPAPVQLGAVRARLHTYKDKGTARLYVHRTDGSYTFVCASPCTADLPANSELRVTLANNDEEPHTFVLPGDMGPEVELEVRPPSAGALIGSVVLMGSGGAFVVSGLLFVALSDVKYNSYYGQQTTSSTYKTTGFVMMGLGAAAAVAGFVWLLSRSHEPRVLQVPRRGNEVYGRSATFLGDVAAAKPRDPATTTPPPFTPLQLDFTF